jgi:hypothetical protein
MAGNSMPIDPRQKRPTQTPNWANLPVGASLNGSMELRVYLSPRKTFPSVER